METVRLDFVPPSAPDIVALRIEEATAKEGVFAEIESTTAVGTYPNYISYYTTNAATSVSNWFRIRWEAADGILSAYSEPLQGGTKTLVQEIVDRVLLRMPTANEIIVTQEAQATISIVFATDDPNSILVEEATPVQIRGITNLVMARTMAGSYYVSVGTTDKFTAGLVSLQSGSSGSAGGSMADAIKELLKLANEDLGIGASYVLLMQGACDTYCGVSLQPVHGIDLTRTTLTLYDYEEQGA